MLENHFFSCSLSRLKRKAEILIAVCNEFAVKRSLIYEPGNGKPCSEVRAMAALIIQDYEGITLSALSKELRRDVSALSQSAGRLRKRMRNNQALQNRQESVVELIKTPKCQHCPRLLTQTLRLSDSIFGWSANQIIGTIKQLMPDITKFTSGSDNEAGQSK